MENLTKQILVNVDNGIFNHVDNAVAEKFSAIGFYRSSGSPSAWTEWYNINIPSSNINDVLDEMKAMHLENMAQNSHITYGSNKWAVNIQFNIKLFNKE